MSQADSINAKQQSWLTRSSHETQLDLTQIKALSSKLLSFLRIMLEEVEKLGFTNQEFLEKMELFTRAVLLTYPKEDFKQLLTIMLDVYPKFYQTKFYMGLIALRRVCSLEFTQKFPGLENIPKGLLPELQEGMDLDHDTIFFITHLMLNISQSINEMRNKPELSTIPAGQLRQQVSDGFPGILAHTITWMQTRHA